MQIVEKREYWSSRAGFILATIGSAVGLGSIWKFPYEVGSNGGSAFVFFYLIGLVLIVFPLMVVEFAVGRRGKSDAGRSVAVVATLAGASPRWSYIGLLGVAISFLVLSFYSVIGGWAIAYVFDTLRNGLLPGFGQATIFDILDHLTSNLLLPVDGLALAVFGGWIVPERFLAGELGLGPRATKLLRIVLRYVATSAIVAAGLAPLFLQH
jgi:SNF family Na+-dependent transporter